MIGGAGLWHRITAGAAAALLGLAPFPDGLGDLGGPGGLDGLDEDTIGPPGPQW
ncbi:hypothetical protein [Streptomyces erythrochromogenes]|uniref:hypothetical protein n=1 Tax=Streptomyces erythrochromogenes TaxID=285574 RepID=UPI00380219BD